MFTKHKFKIFRIIFGMLIFFLSTLLTSCKFPRDPDHTFSTIQKTQQLKVGACTEAEDSLYVKEKNLIEALAKTIPAQIEWTTGGQESLYRMLSKQKVDIVMCGIHSDSPWKDKLAFSRSFDQTLTENHKIDYVFASKQGENAWLSFVNKFIMKQNKVN